MANKTVQITKQQEDLNLENKIFVNSNN